MKIKIDKFFNSEYKLKRKRGNQNADVSTMKKLIILLFILFFTFGGLSFKSEQISKVSSSSIEQKVKKGVALNLFRELPLYFIENKGQVNGEVKYYAKLSGMNVYFTEEGIVYQFIRKEAEMAKVENIIVKFVGANKKVKIEGLEESEAKVNYFIGNNPEKWIREARTYKKVIYRELYPNIDLVIYGKEGKIKNEYRVRRGGRVKDIRIKYEGVRGLRIKGLRDKGEGGLEILLERGKIEEGAPLSYQIIDGKREEVKSEYALINNNTVGFKVEKYRKEKELIIDPELIYSTYLGGSHYDRGQAIAVDGNGNVYVTGYTGSSDFPVTSGAYDTTFNGGWDVFITKLNSTGSSLIYSTYLGGSCDDYSYAIAIDGNGNVYVTGYTASSDFPVTSGAYDTTFNGGWYDIFITKLNSTGSSLIYSTYLGGSNTDCGYAIAIDGNGNAYVTGDTISSDFPVTSSAYDTTFNGDFDVFITKLNSTGSSLIYSTYLGGSRYDRGQAIAVDGNGNAYVTGGTGSPDFPVTSGAHDTTLGFAYDAFITKLNSTGSSLIYSTYLGGGFIDSGYAIAIDGNENVYVTGGTGSSDFPVTSGAYDITLGFTSDGLITKDAFITKLNSTGSSLIYSTYLGGSSDESGYAIAIDRNGNAYVTGVTDSSDFPVTSGAYDTTFNGGGDVFITKLNSTGSSLIYSTYLGGSSDESGYAIAIDRNGNAYVTGYTTSSDFPVTSGAYDTSFNGSFNVFITKLSSSLPSPSGPDINLPSSELSFGKKKIGESYDLEFTIENKGTSELIINSITKTSGDDVFSIVSFPSSVLPGASDTATVRFLPSERKIYNATFKINSNDPDEGEVEFQVSGEGIIDSIIEISKQKIYFGAVRDGVYTSSQTLLISNTGDETLNWQAKKTQDWITITPQSGEDDSVITVSVNPSGLNVGTHTGEIIIEDSNNPDVSEKVDVILEIYEPWQEVGPFGYFDTPVDGSVVSGNIPVSGWALDDIEVERVEIKREPVEGDPSEAIGADGLIYIGDGVFIKGARTDVESAYSTYPKADRAGWGYMLLTNMLPNQGNGTFTIYAFAYDVTGHRVELGKKVIHCDNASRVKPFGTIDTPEQGGTASGTQYTNFGWALTPPPKEIPTDGSTIWVFVDGVPLGHPVYNNYRSDIATLFPEYANSDGAVGYYHLDTTAYENGVHNIAWSVTDNQGETDGIGSRYFEIENVGGGLGSEGLMIKEEEIGRLRIEVENVRFGMRGEKEVEVRERGDVVEVEIEEVERIEIHFRGNGREYIGWGKTKEKRLPIGSTLDKKKGVFYWLPGPGFLKRHELHFAVSDGDYMSKPIKIVVNIVPRKFGRERKFKK